MGSLVLLDLMGGVALLLWGLHMVHSGILRAFGPDLRLLLTRALKNRFAAFAAGVGLTALLQSSTATALITSSFATEGLVSLVPALAIMLGANVGTTLIVQVLSFNISAAAPILFVIGLVAFRSGARSRIKDVGRVAIGLGLMLLALHILLDTLAPAENAPAVRVFTSAITGDPVMCIVIGAAVTWAVHSSVATVLLIMSLAFAHFISPYASLALVLGANLGSAINPVFEGARRDDPASYRLPLGNLVNRLVGVLLVAPLLRPIVELLQAWQPDLAKMTAEFHVAFNLVTAIIFIGLLDGMARLLEQLLPNRIQEADPARPRYLDESALETPSLALADAARETLHMGDHVEVMLRKVMAAMMTNDRTLVDQVSRMDNAVDKLDEAIKLYVTKLTRGSLDEREGKRAMEIISFTINLEHIGDIIDKNLSELATKKIKRRFQFSPEGAEELSAFHKRTADSLRIAFGVFMSGDVNEARKLLAEKVALRNTELAATERHLDRLREGRPETLETTSLHLDVLRDLRRIHSHICSVAYSALDAAGELLALGHVENDLPTLPAAAPDTVAALGYAASDRSRRGHRSLCKGYPIYYSRIVSRQWRRPMPEKTTTVIKDATPLYDAARTLLGYFLNTWYSHYLGVILGNLRRWWNAGLLGPDGLPNAAFQRVLFDFRALDLDKLTHICGIYFYVMASHKKANYCLLQNRPQKRVLYLRGYDYEISVNAAKGIGVGVSTIETTRFNDIVGRHLGSDFDLFKVLSPKDLYWETVDPQRHFYGAYDKIIHACSTPIRSVYLNAQHWKEGIADLSGRMDYFVVYVSSITESVLWELDHLKQNGYADRTTVVFDRPAILNKAVHSDLRESLPELKIGKILWNPPRKRSTPEDIDALRAELDKDFIVLPVEAFEESVPALKTRIAAAAGPLPPGSRETSVDFRFYPALDDAELDYLHRLDNALRQEIDPDASEAIDCLPFHLNQVQLSIFMSLLFGAHRKAGWALAIYAGIVDAALEFYKAAGRINERVAQQDPPEHSYAEHLALLEDHREAASYIALQFLCSGNTHEFGNYTKAARSTYDPVFAAAKQRAAGFLQIRSEGSRQP